MMQELFSLVVRNRLVKDEEVVTIGPGVHYCHNVYNI